MITYHITTGSALYNYMVGLAAGVTYVDTFTYAIRYANALTASQATVTITLVGANDAPTIGGTATGSVKEDTAGQTTANGMLTISDPDIGQGSSRRRRRPR